MLVDNWHGVLIDGLLTTRDTSQETVFNIGHIL